MLLLPEKAEGIYRNKIFLYKRFYRKKYKSNNFMPIKNDMNELIMHEFGIRNDNKYCHVYYCNKCHKKFSNSYQIFYEEKTDDSILHKVYMPKCPHCESAISEHDVRVLNCKYLSSLNYFIDGNKLKIKFIFFELSNAFYYGKTKISASTPYKEILKISEANNAKKLTAMRKNHNRNPYLKEYKYVFVMNLDTGMSYILPYSINGYYKGEFKNTTYSDFINSLTYFKNWNNVKPLNEIFINIYNSIRKYKMDKYNFYIPRFSEQLKAAGKDSFDYHDFNLLFLFNRFPGINLFSIFYDFCIKSRYDPSIIYYERYIRPKISIQSTNILKALSNAYNVKYQKSIKKYYTSMNNFIYNLDINICAKFVNNHNRNVNGQIYFGIILLFLTMQKQNIKTSNIIKFLDVFTLNVYYNHIYRESISDFIDIFPRLYKRISKIEHFDENKFFNKLSKEAYNNNFLELLIDSIKPYYVIVKEIPEYTINFKDSLKSIHDTLSIDYRRLKQKNRIIKYSDKEKGLSRKYNNINFRLAKDIHELINVGASMNICVGSYGERAYNKECIIVVGYNALNEPVLCIEIVNNILIQTKLMYNNYPKLGDDVTEDLINWISDTKVDFKNTYDLNDNIKKEICNNMNLIIDMKG